MKTPLNLAAWNELETMRRQFEELFQDLATRSETTPKPAQPNQPHWVPALELQDTGRELILRVELPGVARKDIDVQLSRQMVAIAGESPVPPAHPHARRFHTEFRYGKFYRTVPLPVAVAHTQAKADLNNGILTLTLPKWQPQPPQVVKVNLTQTHGTPTPEMITSEPQAVNHKIAPMGTPEKLPQPHHLELTQSSPSTDLDLNEDVWAINT